MFRKGTERSFVNDFTNSPFTEAGNAFGQYFVTSKDGSTIVAAYNNKSEFYVRSGIKNETISIITIPNQAAETIAITGNGSKIAAFERSYYPEPYAGYFQGRVRIFDPLGNLIRTIDNPRSGFNDYFGLAGSFSGDNSVIAIGTPLYSNQPTNSNIYARVHIYNANTGALITTILDPEGSTAPFSPTLFGHRAILNHDGSRVIIAAYQANGNKGRVYVYNATNGALIRTIDNPGNTDEQWGGAIAASDDCSRFIAGELVSFNDPRVFLIDANTGSTLATYNNPASPVIVNIWGRFVAMSADGSTVALAKATSTDGYPNYDIYIYRQNSTTPEKVITAPKNVSDSEFFINLNQDGTLLYVSQPDDYNYAGNGGIRIYSI